VSRDLLHAHVARRLVGEEGHELLRQRAEGRRGRALVAEHRELVGDQRVVGYVHSHRLNLTEVAMTAVPERDREITDCP